jgi:hypothetical protein
MGSMGTISPKFTHSSVICISSCNTYASAHAARSGDAKRGASPRNKTDNAGAGALGAQMQNVTANHFFLWHK